VTEYVVDASVAVEYLLRTPLGVAVADLLDSASLSAPELMDAEVVSVLRREVLLGRLDDARATLAVEDLAHWPVDRISHRELARLAWRYRHNVGAYDAFYVAAARARGVPMLTADGKLTRATGIDVVMQYVRAG
jgi:predicted nucleic acid-binding protein